MPGGIASPVNGPLNPQSPFYHPKSQIRPSQKVLIPSNMGPNNGMIGSIASTQPMLMNSNNSAAGLQQQQQHVYLNSSGIPTTIAVVHPTSNSALIGSAEHSLGGAMCPTHLQTGVVTSTPTPVTFQSQSTGLPTNMTGQEYNSQFQGAAPQYQLVPQG